MLLLTAAAIAASAPSTAPSASVGAAAQATATIRVISGVRLSFSGEQQDVDIPRPRQTVITTADAQQQPAKLIEFE
jgi:hypothetical protein